MLPRPLRILYIAYPLLPVTQASCGGAEQMLWTLESEMGRRGHETAVAACEGSQVSGRLLSTGAAAREPDRFEQRNAEHTARILAMLARAQRSPEPFDIVHDESGGFWRCARAVDAPVLATLHLPRSFYPEDAFQRVPPNLYFNFVSESQRRTFARLACMIGMVRNGIRLEDFASPVERNPGLAEPGLDRGTPKDYVLWVGRICEEKGAHIAIEVARSAGRKLVIAGDVYPFSYHQDYFDREIRPHLETGTVSYVRRPSLAEKIELLQHATALLLPSQVDETSSLVAMEAMACGTPVVAFCRGAIPEVVRDGVTGLVVNSAEEMARAVLRVGEIDPLACRARVEANFTAARMASEYEGLYARIIRAHSQTSKLGSSGAPQVVAA
jgi:glycosyltransferase involved in cell wall biosynthesis